MRIVVDAMGGDYAPGEIVSGAVQAARDFGDEIILVGREADVKAALGEAASLPNIRVVHASEVIDMDEHPANAVKNKPDASMVVGMKLLKAGQADAFVSMGNTGGALAAALFNLGRIKGVQRPALAALFPVKDGWAVMLDMGANADVRPDWLVQFGMMGSVYAERASRGRGWAWCPMVKRRRRATSWSRRRMPCSRPARSISSVTSRARISSSTTPSTWW